MFATSGLALILCHPLHSYFLLLSTLLCSLLSSLHSSLLSSLFPPLFPFLLPTLFPSLFPPLFPFLLPSLFVPLVSPLFDLLSRLAQICEYSVVGQCHALKAQLQSGEITFEDSARTHSLCPSGDIHSFCFSCILILALRSLFLCGT